MSAAAAIVVTLLIDGLAGLSGGLISERWLKQRMGLFVGFAAGALLANVFEEVVPESFKLTGETSVHWLLGGFIVMAIIEWGLGAHHREHGTTLRFGLIASDALHNMSDGAAIAAAWLVSPRVGLTTAVGVILHEIPQEVGDFVLLRHSGMTRLRALGVSAGIQLTAFLGAALIFFAAHARTSVLGAALPFAGGTLLYIAATDLLPELSHGALGPSRWPRLAGFGAGVALMVVFARW